MFTAGESAMVHAAAFRDARLSSLSMDELQIPAEFRGAMVMHVMPMAAMSGQVRIDPEVARREQDLLRPINPTAYGYSPEINFDGFLNRTTSKTGIAQTQVFRDGCIESIISGIVWRKDSFEFITAARIEQAIFELGIKFFSALQNLGAEPPIAVFVSLLDVKGARYNVNEDCFEATGPKLPRARITIPPCVVNDYGDDASYRRSLAFIADCLWNSAGKAKAQWITADGDWRPPAWAKR